MVQALINKKLIAFGLAIVAALAIAGTAAAAGNSGDTKPGWGHGDKNHEHTGPPGHSVHPH